MDHRSSFFDPFNSASALNIAGAIGYAQFLSIPLLGPAATLAIVAAAAAQQSQSQESQPSPPETVEEPAESAPEPEPEVEVESPSAVDTSLESADTSEARLARLEAVEREKLRRTPTTKKLEIRGQGTISVASDSKLHFSMIVKTQNHAHPNLYLDVTDKSCALEWGVRTAFVGSGVPQPVKIEGIYSKGEVPARLVGDGPFKHWLSIDRVNGMLRYGRGYCTSSLTLFSFKYKTANDEGVMKLDHDKWAWLDDLQEVEVSQIGGSELPLQPIIDRFPLVRDIPPYVVKDEVLTLAALEQGFVTVAANLPEECQKLYRNVAGPNIVLDDPEFPHFSEAIRHSINTEGLLGNKLLVKKAGAHGEFKNTYLRITIGGSVGNSPGIPYVLEIWPAGHQSPIHDHGESFAVIKVLHGSINAYYYDSVQDGVTPEKLGSPARLVKGDITWISDQCYQVHQLRNESKTGEVCCTIQCYQYGKNNKTHTEVFTFKEGDKKSEPFMPNSDMTFGEFRRAIKAEYDALHPPPVHS